MRIMTKDEYAQDVFGFNYDELKFNDRLLVDTHPEFNQISEEMIEKGVAEKRRQHSMMSGAMSVMLDDMPDEAWDKLYKAWRKEVINELKTK